jgi:hypothetical protein
VKETIAASTGSFTTPDGCAIAYTLHAAPLQTGVHSRSRVALIHSLALDHSIWDEVAALLVPHADVLT